MYKHFILFTFLLSSLFGLGQSYSKVTQIETIKSFLKEKQKDLNSIQASFSETTNNPMLTESQKGNGYFYYVKTDKIRWENTTSKVIMLMDGKNTKLYEKGKLVQNATAQRITGQIQKMIVGMINGDFLESDEYEVRYFQNTSAYKLELTPKNSRLAKEIKQMNLTFNRTTGLLNTLEMIQKSNISILYGFTDMKINKDIPSTKFNTL